MEAYYTPSNEMRDWKKPLLGKADKSKLVTFADAIIKKKAWVPGPCYTKLYEWNSMKPKDHGRFAKSTRYTIAGEIEKKSKVKEKSSPGANAYDPMSYKASTNYKRTIGNYK